MDYVICANGLLHTPSSSTFKKASKALGMPLRLGYLMRQAQHLLRSDSDFHLIFDRRAEFVAESVSVAREIGSERAAEGDGHRRSGAAARGQRCEGAAEAFARGPWRRRGRRRGAALVKQFILGFLVAERLQGWPPRFLVVGIAIGIVGAAGIG